MSWFDTEMARLPRGPQLAVPGGFQGFREQGQTQTLGSVGSGVQPSPTTTNPGQSGPSGPVMPGAGSTPPQPGASFGDLSDPAAWMQVAGDSNKAVQWLKSQFPDLPDEVAQYYAKVMKGQPGANATEQAGSAQYYLNMIREREYNGNQYVGSAAKGGGHGGGFGSLDSPLLKGYGKEFDYDPTKILGSEAFQAAMAKGQQAIERSAAAKGTVLSGGILKDLQDYGQGMALSAINDDFNRSIGTADFNRGTHWGDTDRQFGRLSDLTRLGQSGAAILNSAGSQYGNQAGNVASQQAENTTNMGQATASANVAGYQPFDWGAALNRRGQRPR